MATRLPDDDPDVVDMHVERVMAMSPKEVRAELRAVGIDPDQALRRMDEMIATILALQSDDKTTGGET